MPKRNAIWILAVAIAALLFTQLPNISSARKSDHEATYKDLDAVAEVLFAVRKHYVSEYDHEKSFNAMISAYLHSLDRFSSYIPQLKEFDERTRGVFGGIGIQITVGEKDNLLTVVSPLEDTPAFRAGVLAGDKIIKINGEEVRISDEFTIEDAVKQLTGEPGTKVQITVRHLTGEEVDIPLVRAKIQVKSVKGWVRANGGHWDSMIDPEAALGYLRVTSFVQTTEADLRAAIDRLRVLGMKGLVLDLRFNPGGLLTSAVKMSDLFLDEGVIVSTRGREGRDYSEITATRNGTEPEFPIVVLVNKFSASAAEIVSGALRDHKRALVVGSRTYGKGTVQTVIPIRDGKAAIKLTTAHYYLPSGRNIHKLEGAKVWGVEPHVVVEMSDRERAAVLHQRAAADVIRKNGPTTQPAAAEQPATQPAAGEEPTTQPAAGEEPTTRPAVAERPTTQPTTRPALKPGEMDRQLKRAVELLREKVRQRTVQTTYDKLLLAG
jgi:carboxyl-terminal processing protease